MTPDAVITEARKLKDRLGPRVLLLAHHYQRPEIVRLADRVGDSLELARFAQAAREADTVVFSGVRFMAEAAAVLCGPGRKVVLPNPGAGCPLAASAALPDVEQAWAELASVVPASEITPVVYMNSDLALKAFSGERGGVVCTSANADRAVAWALERTGRAFFFPDRQLGHNTAAKLGLAASELAVWNAGAPRGGLDDADIRRARLFLWSGGCYVHTAFTPDQVRDARKRHPGGRVYVHPECLPEVVALADAAGSTSFLVAKVRDARPGDVLVIGTELALVRRIADERSDVTVAPLAESICRDMHATTLEHVVAALTDLEAAPAVTTAPGMAPAALLALERMLREL